ncbi:glycosyltransferase family 39 protein [Streptomyces sp. NPDC058371]|uniref:glycosyltransferase family 39 protein n=1 Tax=Streptomyces sp. NPDC058371 TaxID=3346463 RepID=UPI003662B696
MLAIGLWGLDRGGMWRDEAVSFQVARRSVPQIWQLLHSVDAVHGLYYLLMHPVLAVYPGEVPLRLPSVCAAVVTAGLVGALGARLCRPRVGLWAGLLYAVNPMVGHYAQEGRSYAMVAAGAALATLLLVRAVTARARGEGGVRARARVGDWFGYGVVVAVTCLLHELAVLLPLAHAVTLALARMPWRVWRGWLCATGAALVVLLPLVLVSHGQAAQVAWLAPPNGHSVERLAGDFAGPADGVLVPYLVLVVLALRPPSGRRGELSLPAVALPLMLLPPTLLMTVSQAMPLYDERYVLYALAGAPLLAAAGAERLVAAGRFVATGAGWLTPDVRRSGEERAPAAQQPAAGAENLVGAGALTVATGTSPGARGEPHVMGGTSALVRPVRAKTPFARPVRAKTPSARRRAVTRTGGPALAPRRAVTLAGVLTVALVFVGQFPLLEQDRRPENRPDDLAAIADVAARKLRPGDPVLFLPGLGRRSALAYPRGFRGTRDIALRESASASGTLYGQETGPAELRRRLLGLTHVWVVAEPFARQPSWYPQDPTERVKLAVVDEEFVPREQYVRRGATLRLYVRRPPAQPLDLSMT